MTARFRLTRPLDLRRTLGPLRRLGTRWDGDAFWWATRTPAGPGTARYVLESGELAVTAWGDGASWMLERAPVLVGEGDDDSGFVAHHRLVADLRRRLPGLRMGRTEAVFEAVVPTIIGQRVTSEEARTAYRRLVRELGEPAPGPAGLHLPPSPEVLVRTHYWALHRFGIERRRAETIRRSAEHAARLEEASAMAPADALRRLQALPGLGPWTAAEVAQMALGDADAVCTGDYHLPHLVTYALTGEARGSDEQMLELLEPYRGHRARVQRLLVAAGLHAPRFGPRAPLRDIARI